LPHAGAKLTAGKNSNDMFVYCNSLMIVIVAIRMILEKKGMTCKEI
jgi:hypothetical protein